MAGVLPRSVSAAITAQGGGAFSKPSPSKGGFDLMLPKEKSSTKASKDWDAETQSLKLMTDMTSKYTAIAEKFNSAALACVSAYRKTADRCDGPTAVPNQRKYIDIMLNRADMIEALGVQRRLPLIEQATPENMSQVAKVKSDALAALIEALNTAL